MRVCVFLLALVIFASACSPSSPAASDLRADTLESASPASAVAELSRVLLAEQQENAVVSSFSIEVALGMAYLGAGGETADEMTNAVGLTRPRAHRLGELEGVLESRAIQNGDKEILAMSVSNDLWVQEDYELGADYLSAVEATYGAAPSPVDFVDAPEAARETINAKISKDTREKIPNLLAPGSLDDSTRSVLTNAIYFKGPWSKPFSEHSTVPKPFATRDGEVEADMMMQEETFRVADGDDFRAVEMPYRGGDLVALVVFPDEGEFDGVRRDFGAEALADTLDDLDSELLILGVPKFEIRTPLALGPRLRALGMKDAFTPGADFDAIHPRVFIGAVVHEAYIDVNEEGTEAAAATAVVMVDESAPIDPPEPEEFIVDRPFLFYIVDKPTGTLLFSAQVTDPTKTP